ncbi:15-hydroxyprostaglandin dehydrogenase [NAD(+)]-like [Ylistrum balloti]|uniref:15-hydroxyprostaglandin dehydrogenase [NAD(+)]-like n=1 Tax=Ylistrum balloti TaxID=509963 RepID=UPI002905C71C|nr:15-hydroxyprostaglandin dehydrogenase [NAD(+)]-like [Ylistrum balloti]
MKLLGKVAIVTGGAQGLGRGFAEGLLRKGAKVCICDINSATGLATIGSWNKEFGAGKSMFLKCDVTNHDQFEGVMKKVIKEFGGVDILVNNAGVNGEEPDTWRRTIQINMIGVIEGTMLASTYMDKTAGGRGGLVVNIASTAGLTPIFYAPVYAGSKYGVVGYTRSMAANPSARETGISYAALCPAFTNTQLFNKTHSAQKEIKDEILNQVSKVVTDTGIQTVADVVNGFLLLVEADSNNGTVMAVSKQKGIQYINKRRRKPQTNKL